MARARATETTMLSKRSRLTLLACLRTTIASLSCLSTAFLLPILYCASNRMQPALERAPEPAFRSLHIDPHVSRLRGARRVVGVLDRVLEHLRAGEVELGRVIEGAVQVHRHRTALVGLAGGRDEHRRRVDGVG